MVRENHDGVDREVAGAASRAEGRMQRVDVVHESGRAPVSQRGCEEPCSAGDEVASIPDHSGSSMPRKYTCMLSDNVAG